MRFHLLGIPHTITKKEYSSCAFSQKIVKMGQILRMRGHTSIHYGNEASVLECDEHVTVTTMTDMEESYPGHDFVKYGFPDYKLTDKIYQTYYRNTIAEVGRRKQRGDFLLCFFGQGHKPVADAHPDMLVCEPGIGYAGETFAPYKVFESYAGMHAHYGIKKLESMFGDGWYDSTVPNYFDLNDFTYSEEKDDYLLFIGRIGPGKGINVALQTAEATGMRLVVAGMGSISEGQTRTDRPLSEYVTQVGVVGPAERARLMSRARATLCPSMYLEPFCGVQIESMLSGTPVISTDWGAFAEYNLHGVTGYRCRTMDHFIWAARNIDKISPRACRDWAANNFSLERVGEIYDEYWQMVANIHNGSNGWYAANPERAELDWLKRSMPNTGG